MKILKTAIELSHFLNKYHLNVQQGPQLLIGFVPTMGALHEGHMSLIRRAKAECDIVVCSIFVNPTQFNDPKDLAKYPRTPEKDAHMLEKEGCDLVYMPEVEDVYPKGDTYKPIKINLGELDQVLEGAFRPGHFDGVAQVVYRLFTIVKPNKAYFGLKDFQQVMVVKTVAKQLPFPLEVIPCETMREASGLAMSSRNMRLSESEKVIAANISRIMKEAKNAQLSFESYKTLKDKCIQAFNQIEGLRLDYFEIVDEDGLQILNGKPDGKGVMLCAAFVGQVRLIDNMLLK